MEFDKIGIFKKHLVNIESRSTTECEWNKEKYDNSFKQNVVHLDEIQYIYRFPNDRGIVVTLSQKTVNGNKEADLSDVYSYYTIFWLPGQKNFEYNFDDVWGGNCSEVELGKLMNNIKRRKPLYKENK